MTALFVSSVKHNLCQNAPSVNTLLNNRPDRRVGIALLIGSTQALGLTVSGAVHRKCYYQ